MAKKLIMSIVALIGIIALVLTGCGGGGGAAGDLVTVKFLIRNNDLRLEIGNYVMNQLDDLGFTVTPQYGVGSQLAPIWQGDPNLGLWNAYTGAWINTAVPLDEGSNFGFFFTPLAGMGPLWDAYTPTQPFLDVATLLWNNDFTNMSQRQVLFQTALPLSMEDSVRIFVDDRASYTPLRRSVAAAADAYGGIEGSMLWGSTLHFKYGNLTPILPAWDSGTNGTLTVRIALEDLLVQPWNPVAGSNWAFDQFPIRGTCEQGMEYDTRDGLAWPNVASKADVVYQAGLPIGQANTSLPWLTVSTSPGAIAVPPTAWADWNTGNGTWATAGPGVTAKTKAVVYYPTGTFGRPLHDGSTLDEADFLVFAAMQFDRAKVGSPIYDVSYLTQFNAFKSHFKGVEFNFAPGPGYDLIVTTYDDFYALNAELIARGNTWFPTGSMTGGPNLGPWTWHSLALGILAERDLQLAFSQDKAVEPIEWLSFISGPSLAILDGHLTDVQNVADPDYRFLPYANLTGAYINSAEIDARYANLDAWYTARTNFWVASGPYYLYSKDTTAKVMELRAFTAYPNDGDKFFFVVDSDGKTAGQQVPVSPPVHNGPWVDVVTIKVITDEAAAVSQLASNTLDIYAAGMTDPDLFDDVAANANLHYYLSAGLFDEITFNPVGPFFPATGKLNPFSIPAVREAMNWAIERSYIAGEIYGGMAYERYTCIGTQTTDYITNYPALLAATEAAYAYNFALANSTIYAAMMAINGTSYVDGKYYYDAP
ncbi:MAG: ABC transporter substrate-binding protein [Dehalococcoidia bacterium]|nr:ABC transporter substrate-binding protein [Dehalococcoidia bacterium]